MDYSSTGILEKISTIVLSVIIVVGMIMPTSSGGEINEGYTKLIYIMIIVGEITIIACQREIKFKSLMLVFLVIMSVILFSVLTSLFFFNDVDRVTYGTMYAYLSILFFSLLNLEFMKSKIFLFLYYLLSIFILIMGYSILISQNAGQFLIDNFGYSYNELLTNMVVNNKTVGIFGSHSYAAFFYFCFFSSFIYKFFKEQKHTDLLFSAAFLVVMIPLNSNSSILFLFCSFIEICFVLYKMKYTRMLVLFLLLSFFLLCINFSVIWQNYLLITQSSTNGLGGRYSSALFSSNLEYLKNHFGLPVGITYNDSLYYTDSGYFINFFRLGIISIIFYNLIYSKLKRLPKFIMVAFFLFEVGLIITSHIRFLPVMLLLLVVTQIIDMRTEKNEN